MNTIPDELVMEGSIRCLHDREKEVHQRFRELVTAVCAAYRCTCDVEITMGNSLLTNDEALGQIAREVAAEVLGAENITSKGVREKGVTAPHHSKDFRVDEDVLDIGIELQLRMTLRYLGAM